MLAGRWEEVDRIYHAATCTVISLALVVANRRDLRAAGGSLMPVAEAANPRTR